MQKEYQINAIYCKMMKRERWAKHFAICNAIEYFSELLNITQFYCSGRAHYTNVERIVSLMLPHTQKKDNSSWLIQFLVFKADVGYNLKHLSCQQFHHIVRWFYIVQKSKETTQYSLAK